MIHVSPIKVLIPLALVLSVLVSYNFISAQWQAPTSTAPNGNAAAPIHVGPAYQWKTGDLGAVRMLSGLYCDAAGLNCYTTTQLGSVGGSAVTQLTSGAGISLTPSTITSSGSVSINPAYTQRRVATTCAVGQSIRQVNADGTVVCEEVTPTCQLEGQSFTSGYRCRVDQGSCGTGTRYNYLNCGADGSWSDSSFCTISTPSPTPTCP